MLMNSVINKLETLNLKKMAQELQIQRPENIKLSFEERLDGLLNVEIYERQNTRIQNLIKKAMFRYPSATIETISYRAERQLDSSQIKSLAMCNNWIPYYRAIILTGATGVGKSWLACAFGVQACRLNYHVSYMTMNQLLNDIELHLKIGSLNKLKRRFSKIQLLIIDDFGLCNLHNGALNTILLELIDLQSQVGGLIITSQYPVYEWHGLFNDNTIADAILDRIVHRAYDLTINGDSMRKLDKPSS